MAPLALPWLRLWAVATRALFPVSYRSVRKS